MSCNNVMLICVTVTVLILNHDLFFHIGYVNTQTTVHEPNPKLIVEHPPQGMFPLSVLYQYALYVQKKIILVLCRCLEYIICVCGILDLLQTIDGQL